MSFSTAPPRAKARAGSASLNLTDSSLSILRALTSIVDDMDKSDPNASPPVVEAQTLYHRGIPRRRVSTVCHVLESLEMLHKLKSARKKRGEKQTLVRASEGAVGGKLYLQILDGLKLTKVFTSFMAALQSQVARAEHARLGLSLLTHMRFKLTLAAVEHTTADHICSVLDAETITKAGKASANSILDRDLPPPAAHEAPAKSEQGTADASDACRMETGALHDSQLDASSLSAFGLFGMDVDISEEVASGAALWAPAAAAHAHGSERRDEGNTHSDHLSRTPLMKGDVAYSSTHQVERDHLDSAQAQGDGNLPEDGPPKDQSQPNGKHTKDHTPGDPHDQSKPPHLEVVHSNTPDLDWHDIIAAFLRLRGPVRFQRLDAMKVLDMVDDEAKRRMAVDASASTDVVASQEEKLVDQTQGDGSGGNVRGQSLDANSRSDATPALACMTQPSSPRSIHAAVGHFPTGDDIQHDLGLSPSAPRRIQGGTQVSGSFLHGADIQTAQQEPPREPPEDHPSNPQGQKDSKRTKKSPVTNTERRVHEYFCVLEGIQLVREVYCVGKYRSLQGPFCAAREKPIRLEDHNGEQAFNLVVGLLFDKEGAKVEGWCEKDICRLLRCTQALTLLHTASPHR